MGRDDEGGWELLCTPCVAEIVSSLDRAKRMTKTQLFSDVNRSRQTVHRTLKRLIADGYVSVDQERKFPRRKYHILTSAGRELATTPLGRLPDVNVMRKL